MLLEQRGQHRAVARARERAAGLRAGAPRPLSVPVGAEGAGEQQRRERLGVRGRGFEVVARGPRNRLVARACRRGQVGVGNDGSCAPRRFPFVQRHRFAGRPGRRRGLAGQHQPGGARVQRPDRDVPVAGPGRFPSRRGEPADGVGRLPLPHLGGPESGVGHGQPPAPRLLQRVRAERARGVALGGGEVAALQCQPRPHREGRALAPARASAGGCQPGRRAAGVAAGQLGGGGGGEHVGLGGARQPVDPCEQDPRVRRRPCLDRRPHRDAGQPSQAGMLVGGIRIAVAPQTFRRPRVQNGDEAGLLGREHRAEHPPQHRVTAQARPRPPQQQRRCGQRRQRLAGLGDPRHLGATIGRQLGQDAAVQEQSALPGGDALEDLGPEEVLDRAERMRQTGARRLIPQGHARQPHTGRPAVVVIPHRRRLRRSDPAAGHDAEQLPRLGQVKPEIVFVELGQPSGRPQGGDRTARRTGRRQHDPDVVGDPAHELVQRRPGRRVVDDVQPVEHEDQRPG